MPQVMYVVGTYAGRETITEYPSMMHLLVQVREFMRCGGRAIREWESDRVGMLPMFPVFLVQHKDGSQLTDDEWTRVSKVSKT